MAFNFKFIDIILFDVHTAIKPVAIPTILKPAYSFLVDEDSYNSQFAAVFPPGGSGSTIRPLSKRELLRNRLWKNLGKGSLSSVPDYHFLQIPFVFKPANFSVSVNTGSPGVTGVARAYIFLNSLGWASNIRISLKGDITAATAAAFIGNLGSLGGGLSFTVEGAQHGATSVLKKLAGIIRKEIYIDPNSAGDALEVPRHFFVSVAHSTSPPLFYDPISQRKSNQPHDLMTDTQRAEILGILFGKTIQIRDIETYRAKTLATWFSDSSFSLTNFNLGTLLFMQEKVSGPSPDIKRVRCMNSNMATSTLLTLMLRRFHERANIYLSDPQTSLSLAKFLKKTEYSAQLMGANYNNQYFKNFFDHTLKRGSDGYIPF